MQETDFKNLNQTEASWRLLSIVNLSRLLAGVVLLSIFELVGSSSAWGSQHPKLFYAAGLSLLISSIFFGLAIRSRRLTQTTIALFGSICDSLIFALLIHSSGGIGQGIGALLLMSLCAAALILPRQATIFAAAVSFIFLLGQHIVSDIEETTHIGDYTSVGLFGLILFLASLTIQAIGERYRIAEDLALKRGVDLANLSQLNDYVVQRLREGVVVIDDEGKTLLMNLSAANMLNVNDSKKQYSLSQLSPHLFKLWKQAVEQPYSSNQHSLTLDGISSFMPSFIPLGHLRSDGMLMFLEDTSLLIEKVQQSKLAALGRLSASIAHEIRNPLAAISHAEQLLSESEHLQGEDRYFTGLINRHVQRVNEIIENVLSLSRASTGTSEEINLKDWTINFVIDYLQIKQLSSNQIKYNFNEEDVRVPFAKSQLRQIIFEPFHSGSSQSSGLGLYISRELASLNRASLIAQNNESGSAQFELIFADLKRWKPIA